MSESLKNKTLRGTFWGAIERFSVQGVQFLVMIIMARILTPEDYGLVGMLAIFIAVSQSLIDSGFSQALIRKQDRSETDNSTVFYFNIAVGLILYIILFFSAPLIAHFYHEPILIPLTRLISLSIVINSFVVVQRALLTIKIDFKTQAKATMTGAVISGVVGIYMAYNGFGVWSIVAQQLSNFSIIMLLLWMLSNWRPKWIYSWVSFKELFSFGSKLALSGIIDTVYRNIYLIVIGKIFKASDLGYYTRAQQFADFPSANVSGIIQRVTFPILCTIQNDDDRLRDVYRRFLRVSAFIIFPLMMGLAGVAKPFVIIVLKEQWAFAGELLQILCFAMMWYPVHAINLNLLQVKGRSDLFLKLEIYKKAIGVAVIAASVPFGIKGMCYGSILSSIISLIINTYYTGQLLQMGFMKQMRDLMPTMLYSFSMFGIVLVTTHFSHSVLMGFISGTIIGIVYFFAVTFVTHSQDLREVIALFKKNN